MKKKLITLLGLSSLLLVACGGESEQSSQDAQATEVSQTNNEQSQSEENETSETSETTKQKEVYGLNEPLSLYNTDTEEEIASVTVTRVTDNTEAIPDYMKSVEQYNTEDLITINVEYTNISSPENLSFGLHDFQVFNENNEQIYNIGMQEGGDLIGPGRSGAAEFYIESQEELSEIELDLVPMGSTNVAATFKVEVE